MKPLFPFLQLLAWATLVCFSACNDEFEGSLSTQEEDAVVWRPTEVLTRAESQQNFLRDHAVGYSYNAVSGSFSSLDDVRCQVINRAELDRLKGTSYYTLYVVDNTQTDKTEGRVFHSVTEYIQNTNLKANGKAEITLIAGGEAKANCSIFEDGTKDCYLVNVNSKISSGKYLLQADAIAELSKSYPTVLTASFRDAVKQVAEAPNIPEERWRACVDSFINTYGTHVVTYAEMGGSLDALVQIETTRFKTQNFTDYSLSADVLAGMFSYAADSDKTSEEYEYLQDAKCRINVLGGDVSILDALTKMNYYGVNAVDISAFGKWKSSLVFDTDDYKKSTAAVIDMDFTPIYDLVTDETAQKRLRTVIKGNTQDLIDLLGNRNFVNVSFPYAGQTLSYTLGGKTKKSCTAPDVTDVIHAGRHVATICSEHIDAIDSLQDVRVVYPIYEGRIQLYNGLCLHNGHAYSVAWKEDVCMVTDEGEASCDGMVYITAGAPSFTAYQNITYNQGHLLPGIEIDTPFKVDGSYNNSAAVYFVKKTKGNFYLPKTSGKSSITGIPNWTYDTAAKMMKRNDDYVYIYNPNELAYND